MLLSFGINAQIDSTIWYGPNDSAIVKFVYGADYKLTFIDSSLISTTIYEEGVTYQYNASDSLTYYEVQDSNIVRCYDSKDDLLWSYVDYYSNTLDSITTKLANSGGVLGIFDAWGYRPSPNTIIIESKVNITKIEAYNTAGKMIYSNIVESNHALFNTKEKLILVKVYHSDLFVIIKI